VEALVERALAERLVVVDDVGVRDEQVRAELGLESRRLDRN